MAFWNMTPYGHHADERARHRQRKWLRWAGNGALGSWGCTEVWCMPWRTSGILSGVPWGCVVSESAVNTTWSRRKTAPPHPIHHRRDRLSISKSWAVVKIFPGSVKATSYGQHVLERARVRRGSGRAAGVGSSRERVNGNVRVSER